MVSRLRSNNANTGEGSVSSYPQSCARISSTGYMKATRGFLNAGNEPDKPFGGQDSPGNWRKLSKDVLNAVNHELREQNH